MLTLTAESRGRTSATNDISCVPWQREPTLKCKDFPAFQQNTFYVPLNWQWECRVLPTNHGNLRIGPCFLERSPVGKRWGEHRTSWAQCPTAHHRGQSLWGWPWLVELFTGILSTSSLPLLNMLPWWSRIPCSGFPWHLSYHYYHYISFCQRWPDMCGLSMCETDFYHLNY